MKRLNNLIAEIMDVAPGENYIGEIKAAQSILRFIEDERDYEWAAQYFHSGTDGPTMFSTREKITPDTFGEHPIASVKADTFAPAASLAFLATEEAISRKVRAPRYEHGCDECTFLGRHEEYDLYHCTYYDRHETFIAKWGNDNREQLFGVLVGANAHARVIRAAKSLAREAGVTEL